MVKIEATQKELSKVLKHINTPIILLKGDLASGKTTLVKEFVKFLGLGDDVTSPTFSVMNVYSDKVYHYDIYNDGTKKFLQSGLLENLEIEGYHLIEWADEELETILKDYGFTYTTIEIVKKDNKREYLIDEA